METLHSTDDEAVARCTSLLDDGELVVVPTDLRYALAADALNEDALARAYATKRRGADRPMTVCVSGFEDLHHVAYATPLARALADRFWPGPLTLVLKSRPWLPDALTAGGDTVAVRAPASDFARRLARHFGPYTLSGAHREGGAPVLEATQARAALGGEARLLVDAGTLPGGASTVVDARESAAKVLRVGAVAAAEIALDGEF